MNDILFDNGVEYGNKKGFNKIVKKYSRDENKSNPNMESVNGKNAHHKHIHNHLHNIINFG